MSNAKDIKGFATNTTPYSFTLNKKHLSSGNWDTSPAPIPANCADLFIFEAIGVKGTATGAVGYATYDVVSNGGVLGQLTLTFSDPYSGKNSCSSHTDVAGLYVSNNCPEKGGKINGTWHMSLT